MKLILIDTNFFLIPYQHKIDIFQEISRLIDEKYSIVTLSSVLRELESIEEGSMGRDGIAARIALRLIREKRIEVIDSDHAGDKSIIEFAKNNKNVIVCTNDKKLKKKLRQLGVGIIDMRDKSHLGLSWQ
ncbi:MAG: nucleotide-binding protein [Candidatus Altiarchaeales archaeon]|nr:MAG: nucleotide-binding protein [Candidatus Altiarchaeales archaeon]RLI94735.1 MAG: nucleotide-binding protein [Candidatus Altiarchaeales archaeon]RLI94833.1 MAG: nucleotide-binding protein [Candidatus Altiarchaeales archaeon]